MASRESLALLSASQNDDTGTLEADKEKCFCRNNQQCRTCAAFITLQNRRCSYQIITVVNLILLFASCFFAVTGIWQRRYNFVNGDTSRRTGMSDEKGYERLYSPAWDAVEYERRVFYSDEEGNAKFSGKPRAEWDMAWENITEGHLIMLNETGVRALDQPVNEAVNIEGHYFALLEYYHQMHCLDIIRRYIWRDRYPDFRVFQASDDDLFWHIDHCLNLMRQVIMCTADVGLIVYYWEGPGRDPKADVATEHVCRNLDRIQQWVSENMWDEEQRFDPVNNKLDTFSLVRSLRAVK